MKKLNRYVTPSILSLALVLFLGCGKDEPATMEEAMDASREAAQEAAASMEDTAAAAQQAIEDAAE